MGMEISSHLSCAGVNKREMKILSIPALVLFVSLVPACNKPEKKQAMDELNDASAEMANEARKELDSGGLGVETPVDNSRLLAALDKAGDAASGQEKIAINLAKISVNRMAEIMAPLTAASGDLFAGLDFSAVESKEDIDALSEGVRKYRKINGEVKAALGQVFVDDLKKEADKLGLKGKSKAEFFAAFGSKFDRQQPLLQKIRSQDDQLCAIVLDQHDLLRDSFGDWSWNADAEEIVFENDEALEIFNGLAVRLQDVATEQEATQREFLSVQ